MELSLSGRLVESGSGNFLTVREFLDLARRNGYKAVDLRASQLGPDTSDAEFAAIRDALSETGLLVFEGLYGGKLDEAAERDSFVKTVKRLADLGAQGVRVGGDLATLKRFCRLAAPFGLKIFYQMHTGSPFETVASTVRAVAEIDEPNFAVLPEPSNLLLAKERFAEEMFAPLKGIIGGVHVQTVEVRSDAKQTLTLSDGTEVRYERVDYEQNRQLDFTTFFRALRHAGFDGYVNELEPFPGKEKLDDTVARAARFLEKVIGKD